MNITYRYGVKLMRSFLGSHPQPLSKFQIHARDNGMAWLELGRESKKTKENVIGL